MMRVKEEDVIDYVVNKGNGVKGLVQNLDLHHQGLPLQYLQPPEERFDLSKVVYTDSIPIIDVSNLEDPMVAESICKAAENWGFFQIMNHGVPLQVLENMKEAVHRFFELPAEEKRKYLKEYPPSSSAHLGTSFNPRVEKVLEWKDYLHLRYVSDDDASACWPPLCNYYQQYCLIFRDEVLEYMKRSKPVLKRLLEVLMKGLGVKEIDKTKENLLMGTIKINLNYYPICPNPELTAGVGRHSDITSLTCLLQDEIGGLYVRGRGIQAADTWIPVKPITGSLVINIGDTLQIMSNGRYKSIEHCVVANRNKKRVSVPIFVQPGYDAVIGPLSQVLDKGEKPLYKQLLFSDYVKHFFGKAHNGKDTIDFAKI